VISLTAGLLLLRRRGDEVALGPGVVFPPVDALLQLVGVYFILTGLGSAVGPAVDMLFVTQSWVARVGSVAASAVWLAGGWLLLTRPQAVLTWFAVGQSDA